MNSIYQLIIESGYVVDEPPRTYDYSPNYYAVGLDDQDGIRLEVVFDARSNP